MIFPVIPVVPSSERVRDLVVVGVLMLASVGGVTTSFREPELCALLMAGVLAAALWFWHEPRDWLTAVAGAVFGPLLEWVAARYQLWTYPFPSVGGMPAWVFTLWPAFPLVLVRLTHAILPPDPARKDPVSPLGLGLVVLALEIPALATLGNSRPSAALAITGAMLVVALVWLRSPQAFLMVGLSGVFGALCESLPIRAGAWHYPNAAFLGMPCWLPTGYSLFGFALVQVGSGLSAVWSRRRDRNRASAA